MIYHVFISHPYRFIKSNKKDIHFLHMWYAKLLFALILQRWLYGFNETHRNGSTAFFIGIFTMTLELFSIIDATSPRNPHVINPVVMTRAEMFTSVHNDILSFITAPARAIGETAPSLAEQFENDNSNFVGDFAYGTADYLTDTFDWIHDGHAHFTYIHTVIMETVIQSYNDACEIFGRHALERIAAYISGAILTKIHLVKFRG